MTRDIRLTANQILAIRDLARARERELNKRLDRSSYDGKDGMKSRVLTERAEVREIARQMEVARQAIVRQFKEQLT